MRWKDRAGTPIVEGAIVAYNMSGDVVRGKVLGTTAGHAKIELDPQFQYRPPLVPTGTTFEAHISKVRRPDSILVLESP